MLKRNGKNVVVCFLVIACAVTATASTLFAQVITPSALFAVNTAMVSSLGQEEWSFPPKDPDSNHDYSDLNGDDSCPSGMSAAGGGGLHVTFATGNVWTKVPILSANGNGQDTLD